MNPCFMFMRAGVLLGIILPRLPTSTALPTHYLSFVFASLAALATWRFGPEMIATLERVCYGNM